MTPPRLLLKIQISLQTLDELSMDSISHLYLDITPPSPIWQRAGFLLWSKDTHSFCHIPIVTDIAGQVTEDLLIILTHVTIVSIYDRGRHRVTAAITGDYHPVHDIEGIANTRKSLLRWSWNNERLAYS